MSLKIYTLAICLPLYLIAGSLIFAHNLVLVLFIEAGLILCAQMPGELSFVSILVNYIKLG